MSQRIHTDEGAQPVAAYSQATQAGPLVFVSGQIPLVPDTGELLGDDMQRATRQCIANAEAILRKAGLTLESRGQSLCLPHHHGRLRGHGRRLPRRDASALPSSRSCGGPSPAERRPRRNLDDRRTPLNPHTMFFKKFLHYLNPLNLFKKSEGDGLNLRMMHGINKISFFAFLVCLTVMLYRWFLRS